jgi:hypothetical protein
MCCNLKETSGAKGLKFTAVRTSDLKMKLRVECIFLYMCIVMLMVALCCLVRSLITAWEKVDGYSMSVSHPFMDGFTLMDN